MGKKKKERKRQARAAARAAPRATAPPAASAAPTTPAGVADALFDRVQQRVLGVLFGDPGRSYYANEIIALVRSGTGAVQRELARLEQAGLVTVERIGNQKHFRANPDSPVFTELRGIVLKTVGG